MLKMNLQLFGEDDGSDFFDGEDFGVEADTPTEDTTEDFATEEEGQTEEEYQEVQEETHVEEVTEPFLNIKYNKEEKALTREEAQILAQKGMNYDKVQEKLHQIENNVGLQYLNELAQRNGVTIDDMVNHWKAQEEQAKLNELIQNNIPEEYAREMLESRKFREEAQRKQAEEVKQAEQRKEFDDFISQYPNVDPKTIPTSVWESTEKGIPLRYAYQEYELSQLRNENKVLKTQSKNKSKAPNLNTSTYGTKDNLSHDPFLAGFDSV